MKIRHSRLGGFKTYPQIPQHSNHREVGLSPILLDSGPTLVTHLKPTECSRFGDDYFGGNQPWSETKLLRDHQAREEC